MDEKLITEKRRIMSKRDIRYHPPEHMKGLGELRGVTEPAAVVLRPDGSIDAYGHVTVVDQTPGQQNGPLHEHGGYAPHSHEVRADHLGVSRLGPAQGD